MKAPIVQEILDDGRHRLVNKVTGEFTHWAMETEFCELDGRIGYHSIQKGGPSWGVCSIKEYVKMAAVRLNKESRPPKNGQTTGIQPFRIGDVVLIDGEEHIIQSASLLGPREVEYSTNRSAWHLHKHITLVRGADEDSLARLHAHMQAEEDEGEDADS